METSVYRGTVGLSASVLDPPDEVTALAITCWDDRFSLHGVYPRSTPMAEGWPGPRTNIAISTDVGTVHTSDSRGGHGHPRTLWHISFTPTLPAETRALTLSAVTDDAEVSTTIPLPRWPAAVIDASASPAPPDDGSIHVLHDDGPAAPSHVVPLCADMGVDGDIRRVATHLYCWPSWFMLTVEAAGDHIPMTRESPFNRPWYLEDDRGRRYHGAMRGGWSGADTGVHVVCAPGLDPLARELRLTFTDPFGRSGRLSAVVPLAGHETWS